MRKLNDENEVSGENDQMTKKKKKPESTDISKQRDGCK